MTTEEFKLLAVDHLETLKSIFPWAIDLRATLVLRDPEDDEGCRAVIITEDADPIEAVRAALNQERRNDRPMQEVAALVLCKSELFFQTAIGETVKTEYPCGPEGAQRAADELGLEWREE